MRDTRRKADFFVHKFVFAIIITLFLTFPCRAEEDLMGEIIEFSGADALEDALPESVRENEILSDVDFSISDGNALENVVDKLFELISAAFKREIKGFWAICAFQVVCALLRLHGASFGENEVTDCVCMLCTCGCCYSFAHGSLSLATTAVSEINAFMNAMLPVMASLYTVGGAAATASAQSVGIYAAITLFEQIGASLLKPMFDCCFALTMVCAVGKVNLFGVVRFIKNFVVRLCVTLLSLLISILFFQNTLTGAADSLALRGVKYAAGFIPIVGSLVGEAARTVAAGIGAIKASVGVFAVAAILYAAFVPCAVLICKKTLLCLCGTLGHIIGADKEAAFIEEVNGILSILLSIILSVGIFFILAVTIFIKTAVNL